MASIAKDESRSSIAGIMAATKNTGGEAQRLITGNNGIGSALKIGSHQPLPSNAGIAFNTATGGDWASAVQAIKRELYIN